MTEGSLRAQSRALEDRGQRSAPFADLRVAESGRGYVNNVRLADRSETRSRLTSNPIGLTSRELIERQLRQLRVDAAESNWDGYGGAPLTERGLACAIAFHRSLPPLVPNPDVAVDPDGEVVFEWYLRRGRVFSVTVGESGELSYAGLFETGRAHGVEMQAVVIPWVIAAHLRAIFLE